LLVEDGDELSCDPKRAQSIVVSTGALPQRPDVLLYDSPERQEGLICSVRAPRFNVVPLFEKSLDVIVQRALTTPAGQVVPNGDAHPGYSTEHNATAHADSTGTRDTPMRTIALYLPQFHTIPENDAWWGGGFTEWENVRRGRPLFPGHEQPHVPTGLGYYDLRDAGVRRAQADMAKAYGIDGFCYYHYRFGEKTLLEEPFREVLRSGEPDFPFCLCWANENWTRRWDGGERQILIAQEYSAENDRRFIRELIPAFKDPRYMRVAGAPLLLVYKTADMPDPRGSAAIWRRAVREAGLGDIYLVRVENYAFRLTNFLRRRAPSPEEIGFDAALEFAPFWEQTGPALLDLAEATLPAGRVPRGVTVFDYERCVRAMMARPRPRYPLFRSVFPRWDNTARRKHGAAIFVNASPAKYADWLSAMARYTRTTFRDDEQLLFINAWNEWGEGCHLEPDEAHGMAYLEATKAALNPLAGTSGGTGASPEGREHVASPRFAVAPGRASTERLRERLRGIYALLRARL
jgi:hypothetical protein